MVANFDWEQLQRERHPYGGGGQGGGLSSLSPKLQI